MQELAHAAVPTQPTHDWRLHLHAWGMSHALGTQTATSPPHAPKQAPHLCAGVANVARGPWGCLRPQRQNVLRQEARRARRLAGAPELAHRTAARAHARLTVSIRDITGLDLPLLAHLPLPCSTLPRECTGWWRGSVTGPQPSHLAHAHVGRAHTRAAVHRHPRAPRVPALLPCERGSRVRVASPDLLTSAARPCTHTLGRHTHVRSAARPVSTVAVPSYKLCMSSLQLVEVCQVNPPGLLRASSNRLSSMHASAAGACGTCLLCCWAGRQPTGSGNRCSGSWPSLGAWPPAPCRCLRSATTTGLATPAPLFA